MMTLKNDKCLAKEMDLEEPFGLFGFDTTIALDRELEWTMRLLLLPV